MNQGLWYSVDVVNIDKKKIADIAQKHSLALVVLFGSQATGYTHKKSDVDIGYLSSRKFDYRESYDITQSLAPLFKNRDIELVCLDNIAPDIQKSVAMHGVVLFEERNGIFELFSLAAHRRYIETKPLRAYRLFFIKHFLRKYA